MHLFDVSAVVIRKAKPASMSVTWVVTQSVLVVSAIWLFLFSVSAVAIRKAKPASVLVTWQ